jgi:hypothetical protein
MGGARFLTPRPHRDVEEGDRSLSGPRATPSTGRPAVILPQPRIFEVVSIGRRVYAAVVLGLAVPALIYALTRIGAAIYINCHARS